MRTWLSDYAAKLLASGLIKREKLMGGFTSLVSPNCQLCSKSLSAQSTVVVRVHCLSCFEN